MHFNLQGTAMKSHLINTYGGSTTNPVPDAAYYCYTIYDSPNNMLYSGVRGIAGRTTHDLLINYFTSSSNSMLRTRLKSHPHLFEIYVEYFNTREEAALAEKKYHKKYNVGGSASFYNVQNSSGSSCGTGSVLCRDVDGAIIRLSSAEYAADQTVKHCSAGEVNVFRKDDPTKTMIRIRVVDYDTEIYAATSYGFVAAYDKEIGNTRHVPLDEFNGNPNRYVGVTKNQVAALDMETGKGVMIPQDVFDANRDRYVGHTANKTTVVDRETGERVTMSSAEYAAKREQYAHFSEGQVVVFDVQTGENVKITKGEFAENPDRYANLTTRVFHYLDGKFFISFSSIKVYYRGTRGVNVPSKVRASALSEFDNEILTITKKDYIDVLREQAKNKTN